MGVRIEWVPYIFFFYDKSASAFFVARLFHFGGGARANLSFPRRPSRVLVFDAWVRSTTIAPIPPFANPFAPSFRFPSRLYTTYYVRSAKIALVSAYGSNDIYRSSRVCVVVRARLRSSQAGRLPDGTRLKAR